jgi:hypothetical protein
VESFSGDMKSQPEKHVGLRRHRNLDTKVLVPIALQPWKEFLQRCVNAG